MSSEDVEKQLMRGTHSGLFSAGFFKQDTNTVRAKNNLRALILHFTQNKELFGEHFEYIKRVLEVGIEVAEKFQASKERSFNALTLT